MKVLIQKLRQNTENYLKSKLFVRLFASYAIVILAFVSAYTGWYFYSYRRDFIRSQSQIMDQKATSWAVYMEQQLLNAQQVCSTVNISDNCRDVLQTVYVEKKPATTMQLYKLLNELKHIKGSSSNMSIYNLVLTFQGDERAYVAGAVLPLPGLAQMITARPWLGISSVSNLIGVSGSANILLNKEFFIYADYYTTTYTPASPKGNVMVLFDSTILESGAWDTLGRVAGMSIVRNDELLMSYGTITSHSFIRQSSLHPDLSFVVYAPDNFLEPSYWSLRTLLPAIMIILVGLVLLVITYYQAIRYYHPINSIGKMVERTGESNNEFDDIMAGITNLIGQRNGYREKMITISPYAEQGVLHSLLNGKQAGAQLDMLIDEQFVELRRSYYTLGIVSLSIQSDGESPIPPQRYRDALELISRVCKDLRTKDYKVVSSSRSTQALYVIASSNDDIDMAPVFHELWKRSMEAIDDDQLSITIGVSKQQNDLDELPEAVKSAERALEQMLTGGRNAVYFDEQVSQETSSYYFPKDTLQKMIHGLQEEQPQELSALMDDLYRHNITDMDLSPAQVRLFVDELHLTVRNALQEVFDASTTHMRIEPIREAVTIDEIFNYYRHVLHMAMTEGQRILAPENTEALETEMCSYLEANLYNPDLSLNAMADQFGVSTKMIGLMCKRLYGQTFLNYVRSRQIEHAVKLLEETDLGLEEIARQCGFSSALTFRRNFKSVTGKNPSDLRK